MICMNRKMQVAEHLKFPHWETSASQIKIIKKTNKRKQKIRKSLFVFMRIFEFFRVQMLQKRTNRANRLLGCWNAFKILNKWELGWSLHMRTRLCLCDIWVRLNHMPAFFSAPVTDWGSSHHSHPPPYGLHADPIAFAQSLRPRPAGQRLGSVLVCLLKQHYLGIL